MAGYALLSALGKDRPGIVAGISEVLSRTDCNIEDSSMTRLGDSFACLLVVQLPAGVTTHQLDTALAPVQTQFGLTVHLADLHPSVAVEPPADFPQYAVEVHGADRKGIVHEITAHLAQKSVSIVNLTTRLARDEPPTYLMRMQVEVPHFVDVGALQAALAEIGSRIGVKVTMNPAPSVTA